MRPGARSRAALPLVSRPPAATGGSRFWALARDNSDDEEVGQVSSGGSEGEGLTRAQQPCSLGDFVARAEELGGSFQAGCHRRFAPGGRGARRRVPFRGRVPRAR